MQPHDTFDLVLNIVVLVMMPLIIWANVSPTRDAERR